MDSSNNFNQQQAPVIVPPQGQPGNPGTLGYQFSSDELRVLRECNSESFWQRSLPLSSSMGFATWYCVKNGILPGNVKFGAMPKTFVAIACGYFLGKFSYQQKCAEKIMQLPDSRLGDALRRKKKGEFFENIRPDGSLTMAPFGGTTDVYTDENMKQAEKSSQNNSLDLDLDRPFNSGLDDTFRPSIDTPDRSFSDNLPQEPPKSSTTYEELRRQNRAEYDRKAQNPYYRPVPPEEATPVIRSTAPRAESVEPAGPKNKYGDVWTK